MFGTSFGSDGRAESVQRMVTSFHFSVDLAQQCFGKRWGYVVTIRYGVRFRFGEGKMLDVGEVNIGMLFLNPLDDLCGFWERYYA